MINMAQMLSFYRTPSGYSQGVLVPEKFTFVWKDLKKEITPQELEKYQCPSCKKLLLQAMQKECGHRICLRCSEKSKADNTSKLCVVCNAHSEQDDNPDFAFRRDIRNRILAVCPNKPLCTWSGQAEAIEEHIPNCKGVGSMCQFGCGSPVDPNASSSHYQTCSFRQTLCKSCSAPLKDFQRNEHFLKDCPTHFCFGCGQTFPSKDNLYGHVVTCKNAHVPCPMYATARCRQWVHISDVERHVFNAEHMLILFEHLGTTVSQVQKAMSESQGRGNAVTVLPQKKEISASPPKSFTPVVRDSEVVKTLVDTAMMDIKQDVQRLDRNIQQLSTRVDILEVRSQTGIFVWKLDNLKRRVRDAEASKVVSLYSPPFSTSVHGYRMCLRAYLNGDGAGRGEYISLFLVMMQSDHDDLLQWPFMYKVTMYLLNQVDKTKTIKQSFMPSKESASFKKPTSSFNLASGFPKFAQKRVLSQEGFVKNDILYIKCVVDTSKISEGPDIDP